MLFLRRNCSIVLHLREEQHGVHEVTPRQVAALPPRQAKDGSTVTMRAPAEQALGSIRNMLSAETKIMRKRHGRAI
jgi:hypothetical protein